MFSSKKTKIIKTERKVLQLTDKYYPRLILLGGGFMIAGTISAILFGLVGTESIDTTKNIFFSLAVIAFAILSLLTAIYFFFLALRLYVERRSKNNLMAISGFFLGFCACCFFAYIAALSIYAFLKSFWFSD